MARKVDPNAKPEMPVIAKADPAADDLFVLVPDVEMDIAGRKLTVREYRFIDGLRARAQGKPLTDALTVMLQQPGATTADAEDELDLLAEHETLVRQLMADSIEGIDADFLDSLDGTEGERLLATWWQVSGRFFIRLALRKVIAQAVRQLNTPPVGATSSAPSVPAATDAPAISAPSTRSVN